MNDRNTRFKQLYSQTLEHFVSSPHYVIGVGSIGGSVLKGLCQIGVNEVTIVDFDLVEEANLGPQGFEDHQIGLLKTLARKEQFEKLSPSTNIELRSRRFKKSDEYKPNAYWWLMVDSLKTREIIFNVAVKHNYHRILDCRMAGIVFETYCISKPEHEIIYESQLKWAQENPLNEGCSSKSTPFVPMIAAGTALGMALGMNSPFKVASDLLSYQSTVEY